MGKCNGGEPGCDGKSRNSESWCGTCTRTKRAAGEKVVNKGSPSTAALSKALKKRPHGRSAYEQGECDRYALRCVSQCTQCLWQCICSNMRRADSRICECTRSVIFLVRHHQGQEALSDRQQGCERRTSQVESLRVLDRPGISGHRSVLPRLARPPACAHVLTTLSLTHDLHFVSNQLNNQMNNETRHKFEKQARHKSKAGAELTVLEAQYMSRYCHPTPCYSLASLSQACTVTDTSRFD